ncbi:MAG: LysR family transcriptional regulator [Mariprofundales bacterium]|nr:LysR family transcriptional regulator [Mariprofundales bacterium]
MSFSLRQLQIFEMVAEEGSFSRAAEKLFLTQPAVSIQIKRIEEAVSLPLFDRLGKQALLTQAGQELLLHSRVIHQQIDEAKRMLADLHDLKHGSITLTMAATANYFAPQIIAGFHKLFPDARITLEVANRAGLIIALEENRADMVIMGRPPDGLAVDMAAFCENPLVVIASPSHALATQRNISLERLAQESFIMREAASGTRIAAQRFFDLHGLQPNIAMEMNRTEAIKQAVMAELGVGIVSLHTLDMELQLRRLVVLDVVEFPIMRHWYLVHRSGKRLAGMPQAFKSFVLEQAGDLLSLPQWQQDRYE